MRQLLKKIDGETNQKHNADTPNSLLRQCIFTSARAILQMGRKPLETTQMVQFFFPSIRTAGQPESALRSLQRRLKRWRMDVRMSVNPLIASGFSIGLVGGFSITCHRIKGAASEMEPAFVCQTYHVTFQGLLEPRRPPAPLGTRTWIRLGCSHFEADKWTAVKCACMNARVHTWEPQWRFIHVHCIKSLKGHWHVQTSN